MEKQDSEQSYFHFYSQVVFDWLFSSEKEKPVNPSTSTTNTRSSFFSYLPSKSTVAETLLDIGWEALTSIPDSRLTYFALGLYILSEITPALAKQPISVNSFKGDSKTKFCYTRYLKEAVDFTEVQKKCHFKEIKLANCFNEIERYSKIVGKGDDARPTHVASLWANREIVPKDEDVINCLAEIYPADYTLLWITLGVLAPVALLFLYLKIQCCIADGECCCKPQNNQEDNYEMDDYEDRPGYQNV